MSTITNLDEREVLLEYRVVGVYVKVSAIDPVTRTEISIVGDRSRSEAALARVAVNKLKFVLAKQGGDTGAQIIEPAASC